MFRDRLRTLLSLLIHLLLHGVVLSHSVWVGSNTNGKEVELGALVGSENADIAILTPVTTPRVLNEPELPAVGLALPTEDFDDMLAVEFEGIVSTVVNTILVGEEVSKDDHLCDDRTILHDLLLDAYVVLGETVVDNFVELRISSALICLEVLINIA